MSVLHEARVVLQPNEEWRFEVDHGSQAVISLAEGRAELFGSELVPERRYAFSGAKLAVFSWHGCTLEVEGAVTHQYIARETPMLEVLAIHEELESRRHAALGALGAGPRVMVVGPDDSGKTTMCRLLANYAAWRGHGVTYVDLDVSQPSALVPGAITASAWPRPLDVEQGHEFTAPLGFWVGQTALTAESSSAFRHAVHSLSLELAKLARAHLGARTAGLVVDSKGWADADGYDALVAAGEALAIDTFVVLSDDRLFSRLTTYFAHRDVLVTRAAKSGGVVVRSQAFRRESQVEALRRYFYGIGGQLCPHLTVLAFSTVTLAALEAAPPPSADALPVGQTVQRHAVRLQRLADSAWPSMLKTVLAVLFAPHRADDGAILSAHMAGAVYVTSVDVENGRVTVLAPSPVALPGAVLLKGAQKWLEVSR